MNVRAADYWRNGGLGRNTGTKYDGKFVYTNKDLCHADREAFKRARILKNSRDNDQKLSKNVYEDVSDDEYVEAEEILVPVSEPPVSEPPVSEPPVKTPRQNHDSNQKRNQITEEKNRTRRSSSGF